MHLFDHLIEHNRYLNIVGIVAVLLIAALFSHKRRFINLRLVVTGLALQMLIAFMVLGTSGGTAGLQLVASGVSKLYSCADEGISFIFGNLANPAMPWGFIFAVKVLPVIIFFGAFMALLFHMGIIQRVVAGINFLIRPLLGTSGAETLCAIANSFLGQTEAPLLVRNYLSGMTKSELLVVMVSGMATISGSILVVFAAMGVPAPHLLAASVMAIPGSLIISKILYPETETSLTARGNAVVHGAVETKNSVDAIARGTTDGLNLALNVGAMLISFLALLALLNSLLGFASVEVNKLILNAGFSYQLPVLSVAVIFGYIFYPFAFLMGFTGQEAIQAAQLLGTKVSVNELIAYSQMVTMNLSERTLGILTYALCGFSNFSCIGIQIGGIGALAPEKREWLTQLGLYAVLGGALSNILSAMIAGLIL